jgi:hypothetical protein
VVRHQFDHLIFERLGLMKVMLVWRTVPGKYTTALQEFQRTGAPLPAGVERIGRWHVPGSFLGWHLVDGDLTAIAEAVGEWADLLEVEAYPVIEDAEASTAVTRLLEK